MKQDDGHFLLSIHELHVFKKKEPLWMKRNERDGRVFQRYHLRITL